MSSNNREVSKNPVHHGGRFSTGLKKVSLSSRYSDRALRQRRGGQRSPSTTEVIESSKLTYTRRVLTHVVLKIVDIALLVVVGTYTFQSLEQYIVRPSDRTFTCGELKGISHAFQDNTVTSKFLLLQALVMPYIIIEICEWLFARSAISNMSSLETLAIQMANSTVMSLKYLVGFIVHIVIMQVVKSLVGRLRPNFISMCEPDWTAIGVDCLTADPSTVIHNAHCTGDEHWVRQGRSSFPSGHSSVSVFMALFCVLYTREMSLLCRASQSQLYAITHSETSGDSETDEETLSRETGRRHSRTMHTRANSARKLCGVLRRYIVPLAVIYAVFVCGSRVYDRWHHPTDVLGGIILGSVTSFLTFGLPSLAQATHARHFQV